MRVSLKLLTLVFLKDSVVINGNYYASMVLLDQGPEEIPSNSQPCGGGGLRFRTALLRVSPGSGWEKRGSADSGRAESHGAIHRRIPKGQYIT